MAKIFYPEPGVTWQNLHNVMHNPDAEHIFDCSYEPMAYFSFGAPGTIINDRDKHLEFLEYHNTTEVKPPCKVLTCGFDFHTSGRKYKKSVGPLIAHEDFPVVPEWSEVIEWKTRCFHNTILERQHFIERAQLYLGPLQYKKFFIDDDLGTFKLDKLFVSLNQRPKTHRYELIKIFLDRDVMDRGVVRFANSKEKWNQVLHDKKFAPEYFDKLLSNAPNIFSPFKFEDLHGDAHWSIDPYYLTALFDIPPETKTEVNLITQKSLQPVLYKKPFCSIGSANQNTVMKDLGFEIFDEYFDFSQETKDLMSVRTKPQMYAHYDNMLKDLWDMDDSPESLKSLYMSMKPKLEHNIDRFIKILFDDDFVPDVVLEHPESPVCNIVQKSRLCAKTDPYYEKYLP